MATLRMLAIITARQSNLYSLIKISKEINVTAVPKIRGYHCTVITLKRAVIKM